MQSYLEGTIMAPTEVLILTYEAARLLQICSVARVCWIDTLGTHGSNYNHIMCNESRYDGGSNWSSS